jgi:F-type H+/Na+-transporting ATPase subunit alpha
MSATRPGDAGRGDERGPVGVIPFERHTLERAFERFEGTSLTLYSRTYLDDALLRRLQSVLSAIACRQLHIDLKVNPTMDAGAILYIGSDYRVVLDARSKWLSDMRRAVQERKETGDLTGPDETYAFLKKMLTETEPELGVEELLETGSVLEVGDGIALASGLRDVGSQELVEFEGGVYGLAFSLLGEKVGCILLGPEEDIREGSDVERTGHLLRVPVGDSLLGRMVNALGQPIDGKGPIVPKAYLPVERKAPGVVERQPVDVPLHTGIKVIDALVPLGRGQRELIIGDRKIGKTTIAIDTILAQKDTGVICIYASIGQKASSLGRVMRTLEENGALDYTIVVASLPNEPPAFRYLVPYAACAMGEYFMDQGGDAFVVYDDLSKHAVTYREMSALLKRPVGREAYPGDIFYVHSRLLERAARLSDERGGGSLTALPIVETLASDISAFIPTNVISICDGQIVLDTQLFNEGSRPAMDAGLSVSRVGGSAQARVLKQVAGRLRIDLAQYQEMAQFVKFGAEVDVATLRQLARGERSRELLKQGQHAPMPLEHEVLVLFAVEVGMLDSIPVEDLGRFEAELTYYADVHRPQTMDALRTSPGITPALEQELRDLVGEFIGQWGSPMPGGYGRLGDRPDEAESDAADDTAVGGEQGEGPAEPVGVTTDGAET